MSVARDERDEDGADLERLGYQQELKRVLGLFDNFSIAFSYLSPMVGVYSLFVLGAGAAGPRGALFNFDWITLVVMILLVLIGAVYFVLARPDRRLAGPGPEPVTRPTESPAADR